MASIGNAKAESLSDAPRALPSTTPSTVEPIFAPIITPTPLASEITHAPTNATVITETIVLLCAIVETIVPEITAFRIVSVYDLRILFKVAMDPCMRVSSINFIPKRNIHSPARNARIGVEELNTYLVYSPLQKRQKIELTK